jgi:hypothetical protein
MKLIEEIGCNHKDNLDEIEKALRFKQKDILDCELKQRQKLKRVIK